MFAVVGNGPVQRNHSKEIEACDSVIRFQYLQQYSTGCLGKRTDVYCCWNCGKGAFVTDMATGKKRLPSYGWQANRYWLFGDEHTRDYVSTYKLNHSRLRVISFYFIRRYRRFYKRHHPKHWPTLGFVTLMYMKEIYGAEELKLFGFSYQQPKSTHHMPFEQKYVADNFDVRI